MASTSKRRPENAPGTFYVDTTCIDCDTCRWMAPETFDRAGELSRVHSQPGDEAATRRAAHALLACPTASIGTEERVPLKDAMADFPLPIDDEVSHCGFHAESSFGAAAYFLRRDGGNVLVDSPRFAAPLVRRLEELGGVRWMFLTHRDDVADHAKFAEHFGCTRVLHEGDVSGDLHDVERIVTGTDRVQLTDDLLVIPTPGHTRGSACLAHRDVHLFTGDHLAWSDNRDRLVAFHSVCWYDWGVQTASMAALADVPFEWVLPGHGRRRRLAPGSSRAAIEDCVRWMETL